MAAPITDLRASLKAIIVAEFASEGFPVRDDRLHPALGVDGPVAAVFPLDIGPRPGRMNDAAFRVGVQVYDRWNRDPVDPAEIVDPAPIEAWAFRLQQALERAVDPGTPGVWFYNLLEITFPPDPKGNVTRFEATVQGYGQNPALIETAG